MPIQRIYRTANTQLATYEWADLASNNGYLDFYGYGVETATSGMTYILNSKAVFPKIDEDLGLSGSKFTTLKATTLSGAFDITINRPLIADGTAYVEYTPFADGLHTGSETFNCDSIINLYHVRAGVQTLLGGPIWDRVSHPGNSASIKVGHQVASMSIPRTFFKKGDKLRAELFLSNGASSNGGSNGGIFCDPTNTQVATGTDYPTAFIVKLPVDLQQ